MLARFSEWVHVEPSCAGKSLMVIGQNSVTIILQQQTHERLGPVEFTAIAEFLSYGTIQSIPDARDREGRKVLNVFPRYAPEPTEEDELDPTRAMMYMLERDLWDPQTQRVGFLVVLDFHKAPFRMNKNSQKSITDTLQVRSSLLLNKQIEEVDKSIHQTHKHNESIISLQNCYPARVGGTLIVDPPWFFKILFTIARPFLKKKTLDRTKVISRKDLTKYISEDNLHPELGGAHSYSHKKWLKKQHKKHALPLSPKAERNFSRYHQPNR